MVSLRWVVERICPNGGHDKASGEPVGLPRFPAGPGAFSSRLVVLLASLGTSGAGRVSLCHAAAYIHCARQKQSNASFLLCCVLYPSRSRSAAQLFLTSMFAGTSGSGPLGGIHRQTNRLKAAHRCLSSMYVVKPLSRITRNFSL